MSQESAFSYIRHGQTPFFRLPMAAIDQSGSAQYQGAHAVLLGVPFDGGTTYQPGARLAPYHVRRVSALVQGHHPGHRIDVFEALSAVDGGNVAIPPFAPATVRQLVQTEITHVLTAGAAPFVVGGDHSVALPILRAVAAVHGPVAVLHVDAHLDTSDEGVWGEPFHHGTPFRHALAEGLIERGQLHQVGLRATWGRSDEAAFARSYDARMHAATDVQRRGVEAIAADVLAAVGKRPLYVSFDIDAVDPAFAPGTGTPVPGGLTSREALCLLRGLAGADVVGMDLCEVCPPLDHADATSNLAAHLLFEGLALAAVHRARAR